MLSCEEEHYKQSCSESSCSLPRLVTFSLLKPRWYFVCDTWLATDKGDGSIQRLLPVTPPEEVAQFMRLFKFGSKKELSDEHLWVSLVSRPTWSNFTRAQRLTCCLCLLFTTMIANAMWYGRLEEEDPGQVVKLGPFIWSTKQLFVATMSSLLVVPINYVVIQIFRRSKQRHRYKTPPFVLEANGGETLYGGAGEGRREGGEEARARRRGNGSPSQLFSGVDDLCSKQNQKNVTMAQFTSKVCPVEPPPTKKSGCPSLRFPWWFIYVGWCIAFATVAASAFFILLYSLEWGSEKSGSWLTAMAIGLLESFFVIQPIKVGLSTT